MKSFLHLLAAFVLLVFSANAQTKTVPAPKPVSTPGQHSQTPPEPNYRKLGGVDFTTGPIEKAFEKAKALNKPVFIEIYSPNCNHCQSFMPLFASKKVGDVFNEHFVCAKLDIEKQYTQTFLNQKNLYIPEIPFFLFFTPEGKLIHLALSENNADAIILIANTALNPAIRAESYPQHFANGVREANFLIEYGYTSLVRRDAAANKQVMEAYASQIPVEQYNNPTSWSVLKKVIQDIDNPMAQYLINHQEKYKQFGEKEARELADGLIVRKLYSPDANTFPAETFQQLRAMMVKIGIAPSAASARTVLSEISAHFRAKQTEKAVSCLDKHMALAPLGAPECIYVMHFFNQNSPSPADVSAIDRWIRKALSQPKTTLPQKADLYYELAEAYRRANKKEDARRAAEASLKAAQAAKLDSKRNLEQLKAIG